MMQDDECKLVLLTGASGSGLSTAMKALEDSGFMAVDNMPLALIDQLVALVVETEERSLAIALDARTTGFSTQAVARLAENLRNKFAERLSVVHLSASHDDLLRRFNATRRQHPLSDTMPLTDAVAKDTHDMAGLASLADLHLDTSGMKPAEMRSQLLAALDQAADFRTRVRVVSFSYRRRMPEHTDMMLDMRFANNPHWNAELREFTGLDREIEDFLRADKALQDVMDNFRSMLSAMLKRMKEEGRPLLNLAFGCTGGRHRSVWAAESVGKWLREQGHHVTITHREIAVDE